MYSSNIQVYYSNIVYCGCYAAIFTSSQSYTVPALITQLRALVVGGGGGGVAGHNAGGGGGYVKCAMLALSASQSITVTVGEGGGGGVDTSNSGAGSPSSFGSLLSADGGSGSTFNYGQPSGTISF